MLVILTYDINDCFFFVMQIKDANNMYSKVIERLLDSWMKLTHDTKRT